MKRGMVIGLLALFLSSSLVQAGEGLEGITASAEVRHRFEVENKDFNSDTNPSTFSLLRTRLTMKFKPAEGNVSALIQLQDARTFGEETNTLTDASADQLDLHQGALFVKGLFDQPLDVKLGRFEAIYGPQRLIGAVGWSNTGRSVDGITLRHPRENLWVDLFSFKLDEELNPGDVRDEYFSGIWLAWDVDDEHSVQPFWIWEREIPRDDLDRHTLGFHAQREGRVHGEAESAFQTGRITPTAGPHLDVSAFMAALNVGMKFPDAPGNLAVSAGVDYLSGDDGSDADKFKVFDTLLATNHKYYGYMDYFLNIPLNTGGLGLVDSHIKLTAKPGEKTVAKIAAHLFRSAEEGMAGGSTSSDFGTEVDLTVKHGYSENMSFQLGGSFFVPGDLFKESMGEDTSSWLYLMTTFTT